MTKLNLGSGRYNREGYVNIDLDKLSNPDVLWDLNEFPYPFKDNHFKHIEANHILEHLKDVFKVMKELHRILKPNGTLTVRVPHFSRGFTHSEHKRGFDVSFALYFNPKFREGYQGFTFENTKTKLRWLGQPYLKKIYFGKTYYPLAAFGFVCDLLANLSPSLCSRFWCFYVGGFEEIKFEFKK